jgi:hypothetical protein
MSEQLVFPMSFSAGADLSAKQHYIVKISAANTVDLCGAGEAAIGVLQNDPASGRAASVLIIGVTYMVVNGNSVNIAAGDPITSAAGGVGVKGTTDKKGLIGYALQAATADGVKISVLLTGAFQSSL